MPQTVSRQSSVGLFAWLAWGCGALFYAYQFALRVSPSVMASELMQTLSLDAAGFGLLASFYYYGYALFQVPAGSLLDAGELYKKIKRKKSFVLKRFMGASVLCR